jgi:hypothetical protein
VDEPFEAMLRGGHPNSLGRTLEVVDLVLADPGRFAELYSCWSSDDEVVRLRVASAVKRVAAVHPEWVVTVVDGLLTEVAAIDQASTQWTLAQVFHRVRHLLDEGRHRRAVEVMKANVAGHDDWIVLATTLEVLGEWAQDDPDLREWLRPHADRLTRDRRKSVAGRARKVLARLG